MNYIKYLWTFLCVFWIFGEANAQQDGQFSFYTQTQLFFNPAYAGADADQGSASLTHRSNWLGYDASFDDGGSPSTQFLSIVMPLKIGDKSVSYGFGLQFLNETFSFLETQELQLSLSATKQISRSLRFGVGLRLGTYGLGIDGSKLRPVDDDDPLISQLNSSKEFVPDLGLGIYLKSDAYFFGISAAHLLEPGFNFYSPESSYLKRHYNALAGINFDLSARVDFLLSSVFKTDFNTTSFEVSGLADFSDKYYLGLSYRNQDAFILLTGYGFGVDNKLQLFYALDFITPDTRAAKAWTSHEITLRYNISGLVIKLPSPERSTRFRFE